MNIYICSTVRHLLFALCRANKERHEQHYLLFFADYQGASLSDWNLADLPGNTHLFELSRHEFRRRLENSRAGRVSYQFSRSLWSAPVELRKPVIDTLAEFVPNLASSLRAKVPVTLWLFNERNRMARIFRILSPEFNVIEDGESNYNRYSVPWWKMPARLILGLSLRVRAMGDDPRCKEIWVNCPERLAPAIGKKARAINFLGGEATAVLIRKIMGKNALPAVTSRSVILATQPVDGMATISVADKQKIYSTIITCLQNRGHDLILKIHPAEKNSDYEFLAGRVESAPAKVPVEALLLSAIEPPTIVSVSSSAGLGFERYCTRIKLIENNDFATIRRWTRHPEELLACLELSLAGSRTSAAQADIPAGLEQHRVGLS